MTAYVGEIIYKNNKMFDYDGDHGCHHDGDKYDVKALEICQNGVPLKRHFTNRGKKLPFVSLW